MIRTPPSSPSQNPPTVSNSNPPITKLSSVTRKENEINYLLEAIDSSDLSELCDEYTIYLKRVDALYEAAADHKEWLQQHEPKIYQFRNKIENIIHPGQLHSPPRNQDGASADEDIGPSASAAGGSSRCSSSSSARVRLAEQRAKLLARRKLIDRTVKLKKEEIILRAKHEEELLDLELKQEELKNEELEREVEELDRELNSISGNRSVSKTSSRDTRYQEPPPAMDRILEKQNEIAQAMTNCQKQSFLPKRELQNFDGSDVTKYKSFIVNFDRIIVPACNDDGDKFLYLQQYTGGKAKQLIDSCVHYDAATGYRKSREALEKEYGNEFRIANSYLDRINSWPQIPQEDPDKLNDFAILLFDCNNYLENMTSNNQLQNPKEIANIVNKLPYRIRDRWRRKAHSMEEKKTQVKFSDLVYLVQQEAAILKQPLYGKIADIKTKSDIKSKSPKNHGKLSAATVVSFCQYCKKYNHKLQECKFFMTISFKDKSMFVKKQKLCFGCFSTGHISKNCNFRLTCETCGKKHPTILHNPEYSTHQEKDLEVQQQKSLTSEAVATENRSCSSKISLNKIICPILPVKISVKGKTEKILINCALDTCSTDCWLNENLLDKLGLFPQKTTLKISTMSEKNMKMTTKVVNNLQIFDFDETHCTTLPVLFTKPSECWPFSKSDLATPEDVSKFQHLADVPFNFLDDEVGLLIGMSAPDLLKPLEIVDGDADEPYASLHKLGWVVNGPVKEGSTKLRKCNRICIENDIKYDLEQYYNKDFEENTFEKGLSQDDKNWLRDVQASAVKLPNEHFQIDLPLKNNPIFLDNKAQVFKNFLRIKKRLDADEIFKKDYEDFMNNMLEKRYAEKVEPEDISAPKVKYYIAHHGIYHKTKNKLRVVFNCSLKYKDISLNDNLRAGPDLTNNLLGVLLRFRQDKIAFVADVKQMFYQIFVPTHHADLLRFFWLDDQETIAEYRICVHVFGATSSPSVANFALRSTVNETECSLEARSTILRNFYVDDCLKSSPSEQQCIETLKEVKNVLYESGFNLTSFQSNSSEVLRALGSDAVTHETELAQDTMALGIIWNKEKDTLRFKAKLCNEHVEVITKRIILKTLASVYDPIGIISPVLTPAKKIFQEACASNCHWDSPLSSKFTCKWEKWLTGMLDLQTYEIPRCIKITNGFHSTELHIFSDGGEIAYGAVAYVKFNYSDRSSSMIVSSKGRLTPLNNRTLKTIPRIELSAAKLAIELSFIIQDETDLNFQKICYWSDSTTVINYIKGTHLKFHRFVENKVNFIRNFSEANQWAYVPSSQNPADIVSRGSTPKILALSKLWNFGPKFLNGTDELPVQKVEEIPADDAEVKILAASVAHEEIDSTSKLLESVSEWYKLKLRIAALLRLKHALKSKTAFSKELFTVADLKKAEHSVIKFIQDKYFRESIAKINSKLNLSTSNNLHKLAPFIDTLGILRVGGRLKNSDLSYDVKHPIILPPNYVSKLIIRDLHCSLGHLGRESVLAKLRTKFWIIKANVLVRTVCRECLFCRRLLAKRSETLMADLPRDRLTGDLPVFSDVAIDYFGPFITVHGRKSEKRYGVIFSCLASRAIHIEVAYSLTTSSFIQALRRFVSRRGNVRRLRSDNGTNFTGGQKELKQAIHDWNNKTIHNWCLQTDIEWVFNVPCGSHHGGVYERQVRSIRKTLNSMLLQQPLKLYDEDLLTLMCEVEAVLNNRPISPLSDDPDDTEALTPNHLLLFNAGVTYPPGLFSEDDIYARRRWKQTQYLSNLFWSRWKKEYLTLLQQRQKWTKDTPPHKEGDLVLVVDSGSPRNQWQLGRILQTIPSSDGKIRAAKIKISHCKNASLKDFKYSIIERPIVKLILLRSENLD